MQKIYSERRKTMRTRINNDSYSRLTAVEPTLYYFCAWLSSPKEARYVNNKHTHDAVGSLNVATYFSSCNHVLHVYSNLENTFSVEKAEMYDPRHL